MRYGVSPEAVKAELKKTFSERCKISFKTVQELDRLCDQEGRGKMHKLCGIDIGKHKEIVKEIERFSTELKVRSTVTFIFR